jgi:molybdate transport system substrate-binding protein
MKRVAVAFGLGLGILLAQGAPVRAQGPDFAKALEAAKPGDIRVLATAAFRLPDSLIAEAEKVTGRKVIMAYGSARGNLKTAILAGQAFDVALLMPDVNEDILKAGKILPETHNLALVPVAFGLRGDAKVDVSTPAAVKATMLAAKSIKYAPTGAALLTVRKLMADLELAGKVKDNSGTQGEVTLGPGEYEINIYPLSEIIPNTKLKNLGVVIQPLQVPSVIQATVSTNAADAKAARALIKFFQGASIDPALKSLGMIKNTDEGTLKVVGTR